MVPKFSNIAELHGWLLDNKKLVMQSKMAQFKKADAVGGFISSVNDSLVVKGLGPEEVIDLSGDIVVKSVINTTNLFDSHMDVHFPGIWKKNLSENKGLYLLENHQWDFQHVISDSVKAYTETISWSKLGYSYSGNTEALIFESKISPKDSADMHERYIRGKVKNHSVGMSYVKIKMAVNSDDKWFADEKKVWDDYYSLISNKGDVDEAGMFFAVTEAKAFEGSAVLFGSNWATPTMSIEQSIKSTHVEEPQISTHEQEPQEDSSIDWGYILTQLKN